MAGLNQLIRSHSFHLDIQLPNRYKQTEKLSQILKTTCIDKYTKLAYIIGLYYLFLCNISCGYDYNLLYDVYLRFYHLCISFTDPTIMSSGKLHLHQSNQWLIIRKLPFFLFYTWFIIFVQQTWENEHVMINKYVWQVCNNEQIWCVELELYLEKMKLLLPE